MRRGIARFAVLALLAAPLTVPGTASAAPFTALYAFGDSLTDRGNLFALTGGAMPVAPTYVGGQFSNGPTWVNPFSQALGLGPATPSLLGGTVYAYGLARSDAQPPPFGLPASLNLPGQVTTFINGPNDPAGALFAVWAGANNMLQALAAAPSQPNPTAYLAAEASSAATGVLTQLDRLRGDGARDFLVLNLPDLGATPRFNGDPVAAAAGRFASGTFNAALEAGLVLLDAQPGVDVRRLDIFGLFDEVLRAPASFGFTNVTSSCVTGPVPEI